MNLWVTGLIPTSEPLFRQAASFHWKGGSLGKLGLASSSRRAAEGKGEETLSPTRPCSWHERERNDRLEPKSGELVEEQR